MRIGLDAMGGDFAPAAVVDGAVQALGLFSDLELVLVGIEENIRAELAKYQYDTKRLSIVHATQVIDNHESPVDAMRQKKDSSIGRLAQLGSEKEVAAVISAGNTGAFAAATQLRMRTIPGVMRAGVAVTIPAFYGPFVLLDVGANITPKPHHLYQYAIMGSVYAQQVQGFKKLRIGLLSVGEESAKGTDTIKQAHELISADSSLQFIGNVEGRDLFQGVCDVAVCDGFVGNIILKLFEGLSRGIFETISKEIVEADPNLKSAFDAVVSKVWKRHDYTEFGGAPLLGVNGVVMICHGRSDARAIRNAIRTARTFVQSNLNQVLIEKFEAVGTITP